MTDFRNLPSLLDNLELNLTDEEVNRLYKIVKEGKSQNVDNIINLITQKFSKLSPSRQTYYQSDDTSSAEFNEQFSNFFADLIVLYMISDKITKLIEVVDEKNKSKLETLENRLAEIENDLKLKEMVARDREGFSEVTHENFDSANIKADYQPSLFVDPKRKIRLSKDRVCTNNKAANCLLAATIDSIDDYVINYDKTKQSGSSFIKDANKYNNIQNLKSNNPEHKWDETILTPDVLNMEYNDHLFRRYTDLKNNEYKYIRGGALCKIRAMLEMPAPINTILFEPYSEHPFEVVKIIAFPSEESYNLFHREDNFIRALNISSASTILGPEKFNEIEGPIILNKAEIINFTEISECNEAKILEFAVRQRNYENAEYNLTETEAFNIEVIDNMFVDTEVKTSLGEIDGGCMPELDYHNRNINWSLLNKLLKNLSENFDLDESIIDNIGNALEKRIPNFDRNQFKRYFSTSIDDAPVPLRENNRFEYQYGLKNLDIKFENYYNDSIFVSRLHSVKSNIKEVALNVSDSIIKNNSLFNADYTIEYYVSNVESPNMEDWYPLLPENYENICRDEEGIKTNEVISFYSDDDHNIVADLMFEADPEKEALLRNSKGEKLEFVFLEKGKVTSPAAERIIDDAEVTPEKFIIEYYIADYVDPFIVDFEDVSEEKQFVDDDGKTGELFEQGTDENNAITLSFYPYVDYEEVNSAQVKSHGISSDPKLEEYNPDLYKYNPNYEVDNQGYRPIVVEMYGQAEAYDITIDQTTLIDETYYNDSLGIPYEFEYINIEETGAMVKTITRQEEMTENQIVKPHFYNKTDYLSDKTPVLNEYDSQDNPVFEYIHQDNKIYFNDSFAERDSDNIGELRAHYSYLTEGIRVMALMKKKMPESNSTPIIYDYKIKQRDFDL